jgi:hypothetical protein
MLGDSYTQISLCPAILSESRATRKLRALRRISTDKRACVYEYRVNSRITSDTEAIVGCHVDEWSALRTCGPRNLETTVS